MGEAGTTYRPVTEGTTFVKLHTATGKSFSQVLREARQVIQEVPGLTYGLFEAGPFGQKPIQISVRGASVDELDRISRDLMQAMAKMKGVADVETSLEKSKPELRVRVDRARASDLGVPAGVIGTTLRAAVAGEVATVIEDKDGESHDVRVRLRADQRRYSDDLLVLTVPTDKDDDNKDKLLVPVRELATAEVGSGPSTIRRKDLVREVRVSANPDGRSLGEITADIETAAAKLDLPPGYDLQFGGDAEELKVMFENMMQALFLADRLHLPDPGLAVRLVHPALLDHALPAFVPRGRGPGPPHDRRHPEHHEHDRTHHADGPRDQERDPPRGLHEPRAPRGPHSQRGPHQGGLDAPAAHRHDRPSP